MSLLCVGGLEIARPNHLYKIDSLRIPNKEEASFYR